MSNYRVLLPTGLPFAYVSTLFVAQNLALRVDGTAQRFVFGQWVTL